MAYEFAFEWTHADMTPYSVLGVTTSSGIGEIRTAFKRRALETHPDKVGLAPHTASVPFTLVKEAAQILLDPLLRQSYDAHRSQCLVREGGAVSDVYNLHDEFVLTGSPSTAQTELASVWVYQMECRCGGTYEVVLFEDPTAGAPSTTRQKAKRCECDCCSLVIEVMM